MREIKGMKMRSRWTSFAFMAAMTASLTLVVSRPAMAQESQTPASIQLDHLYLAGADLETATKALTERTGLQFLMETSDIPYRKVTLQLGHVSAEDALKYICQAAGAFYRRDENGVFLISHTDPSVGKPTGDVPVVQKKRVTKIKLIHADPKTVYDAILMRKLGDGDQVFNTRTWRELDRFSHLGDLDGRAISSDTTLLQNSVAQPVSNLRVSTPLTNSETGNSILLPGESANQLGGGGGFGGGGGQGGLGGGGGQGGLGGGGGQGGQQVNLQGGQGFVPASISNISYDPSDNSIIVEGTDDDIAKLQRIVSEFDIAPKRVTIKVEFITTSSSLSTALGYDWQYARGTVNAGNTPGTFASAGEPIFLNFATGNVTTRLRARLLEGFGKVVNAPILTTLNNEPASVQSQTRTNILLTQVISAGNGQVVTAPNIVPITITTGLSVAPRINDDGTVTMYLSPQIADFGQTRVLPNGTQVPDILAQTIRVVARVVSGQTMVLGGLTRKSDTGSIQKFPILGDLPIIGQFFRSTSRDRSSSELLIFVTPTILEDDSSSQGI